MKSLSADVLLEISSWMNLRDVSRLALTCKHTYTALAPHKDWILLRFYRQFYGIPGITDLDQVRSMFRYTRLPDCSECNDIEAFFAFMNDPDSDPGYPDIYDPIGEVCLFWGTVRSTRFDPRYDHGKFNAKKWVKDTIIHRNDLIGLEWYLANVDPTGDELMGMALQCNQLDIVMWLHERGLNKGLSEEDLYCHANEFGDIATIAFMRAEYFHDNKEVMDLTFSYLARGGHFDALVWLHPWIRDRLDPEGDDHTFEAIDCAAEQGYTEIVMWLFWHDYEASVWAVNEAARNGHYAVVQFLTGNRIHGTMLADGLMYETAADLAAASGNLKVLDCLLDRGYSLTVAAMDHAARHGDIKIMEVIDARLNPKPPPENAVPACTELALHGAAKGGHLAALQFLHDRGHLRSMDRSDTIPVDYAARRGHLEVVRWLLDQGFAASTAAIDEAARFGHFLVVQVLSTTGCRCTQTAMTYAASFGQVEVMEFLHNFHGLTLLTATVLYEAIRGNNAEVIEYLVAISDDPLPHRWIKRFAQFCGSHDIVRIANGIEYGSLRRGLTEKDQAYIEME